RTLGLHQVRTERLRRRARRGLHLHARVRSAPARHLRDRRHDGRRADLSLPRRATCLPARSAARPASRRDARRRPGTEEGFGYRIPYIAPELVRGALGGRALPFVADPVQEPKPTARPIVALLSDIDDPISELSC